MDILDRPIEALRLTKRALNQLHKKDIWTVRELLMHSRRDLLMTRNLGEKTVAVIVNALARRRLHLGIRVFDIMPRELKHRVASLLKLVPNESVLPYPRKEDHRIYRWLMLAVMHDRSLR